VRGQPDAALANEGAHGGQLTGALVDLVVELRQVRVARVRRERGGHPVHADVVRVEVVEDRPQALERVAQMRARLPAPRVMRWQPARAEHLDGEAQPMRAHAEAP
jgi:hypothetical protein